MHIKSGGFTFKFFSTLSDEDTYNIKSENLGIYPRVSIQFYCQC